MKIKEFEWKDHDEWLAIRKNYIGGSDAAAVIGMNPYKSAYTLWAEKTGRIPEFEGNLTTEVGAYLEEFVAQLFTKETGKKVRKKNRTLVNEMYPWACANVDRVLVGEKALLEIKTTNSFPIMRQLHGTEFPEAYYAQVVHYLAVTGFKKAYLAVLSGGRNFNWFVLERDEAEINALMNAEEDFWQHVENDVPPMVDGSESTSDTLYALYPDSNGETVDLTPMASELDEIDHIKGKIADLESQLREKENLIKDYMKDAERGVYGRYSISFKTQGRKVFDSKSFMSARPDIDYSDYWKVSTSRPFTVRIKKEK